MSTAEPVTPLSERALWSAIVSVSERAHNVPARNYHNNSKQILPELHYLQVTNIKKIKVLPSHMAKVGVSIPTSSHSR